MKFSIGYSLLVAGLLFVSVAHAQEEDYFYDEEQETASTHVPKFTSQPVSLTVMEGENVTLPCMVDKLGSVVTVWKSDQGVLFMNALKQRQDPRLHLEKKGQLGSNLFIESVTAKDMGTYQCQIASNPPINLKHSLMVKYAPSVTTVPDSGVMVVREGKQVTLICKADGSPKPTVTWTKKGGLLPYGEKKHTGERLDIPAVEGSHLGDYVCTVDNGVGQPIVRHIRLEVNYAPQIEVTNEMVHSGAGHAAQVECEIRGQPLPQVEWFRVQGTPLDEAHFQRYQTGYRYGLRIASLRDEDLGVYTCRASNTLGQQDAEVHLTGKPKTAMVVSEPNGDKKDAFTLSWTVESYSPLLEYKIVYRKISEDGENTEWMEAMAPYSGTPEEGSTAYEMSHTLPDLEPASIYEATVTVKNKHGWSDPADEFFRFSTLGANDDSDDGVTGGEALKSTDPNGAEVTSRPGLVCLLAILFSLMALL